MNLAESARRVSPATATMAEAAKAVEHDDEYKVEEAENMDELGSSGAVAAAGRVEPGVTVDDPRKFAPTRFLEEAHRDGMNDISIEKLKEATGTSFEGPAGVCRGMTMSGIRKCTLFLSKFLPAIYDERDFISLGEIMRYIAVKDDVLFVYAEKTDPTYLYSIPLETLQAVKEDPKKPHKRSVTISPGYGSGISRQDDNIENALLLDAQGKLVYQITFNCKDDKEITNRFITAVTSVNLVEKKGGEKK